MNKIKVAFLSLTHLDASVEADYVEWHQMDHMPEQFRIPGIAWGQRFVATPACVAASARREDAYADAHHLQSYLFEDEPLQVMADFSALGRQLDGLGRSRNDATASLQAPFQLIETHAAPRALIHADAVPYRPNHGVYLLVEEIDPAGDVDEWIRATHRRGAGELLDTAGVVGVWEFAAPVNPRSDPPQAAYGLPASPLRISVLYLDEDPPAVAAVLAPKLEARWSGAPVIPRFAGPFRSYFPPPGSWSPLDEDRRA